MPKGNHVFNHFNKTFENAFSAFIIKAGITKDNNGAIDLTTAKVASGSQDAKALAAKLPKAWPKFKEIVGAAPFQLWDEMQDNEEVGESDDNSVQYGNAAKGFVAEIAKIADKGTRAGASPGRYWTQMVNVGYDDAAATRWINIERNKKQARQQHVTATQQWIKGPLNALVATWIQYLKLDMDGKK